MRLQVESGWTDLVFHVLAHVDLAGRPANLYAPAYVAWAAEHSPASRELSEDARVLDGCLQHSSLANALQPLAVLFDNVKQARRVADEDLAGLRPSEVARAEWLALLGDVPQAAELLRCRALLEAERHAALPSGVCDVEAVQVALAALSCCAPRLSSCELRLCRALTRHGRVFGACIYIGWPAARLGVSTAQVAMQGAHEATVLEVRERAQASTLTERAIERVAVLLLSQRAAAAGFGVEHAAWGAQFGVQPEHAQLDLLGSGERALAQQLLFS